MSIPDEQLTLFPEPAQLPAHTYVVPLLARQAFCNSCGATIIWALTPRGAHVPLSVATKHELNGVTVAKSHYTDCPHARAWGKKSEPAP